MNKTQIIEDISKKQTVEKIVYKLANCRSVSNRDYLLDLINDIYLVLLEKPDDLIEGLYERDEIGFFILRIVKNQLLSNKSPYYRKYILPTLLNEYQNINITNVASEENY